MDALLKWRKEFPILKKSTYLISNSLGAMPASVSDRMAEYAETWASRGVRAWPETWWEMSTTVGDAVAPLIGAKRGEVSMHANISALQAMLVSCFNFKGKRNKIVYSDLEFPSVMYVYQEFAKSLGARINIVKTDDGISVPTEKILDAIDDSTLLVPISHVLFKSAYVQDVKPIVEKAHKHGAIVILDAYHSVGIMPVDVRKLGVDILVGGVLKWLCGGPGGAFLWVHPSLQRTLTPKITGWMAHEHPFAFAPEMEFDQTPRRFLNGTPSIPSLYAAAEGPKIIRRVGISAIRKKSLHQTDLIIRKAKEYGFTVVSPLNPKERGGTVTVAVPHAYEVSQELLRREIIVDFREGAGIRIAPHFYNSDDEVLHALDEIRSIVSSKSFKKPARRSIVT
ncbi:MAG TPA: aminotransferase class V-fold PLP-dependent enzyme [Bacteroidota bacterium]|nr:aminotransferase class V-fold PLP-dependent enzyme [Bacteroidota bacterium]